MPDLGLNKLDDAPRVSNSSVHVDTTLQIEQQKAAAQAAPVKVALSTYVFKSTSTYARQEFNRTLIRDLCYLYARCLQIDSLGNLFGEINRSFGSRQGSKNRLTRCIEVLQKFLNERPQKLTPQLEMVRLRSHLANALLNAHLQWNRTVHHEFDGTKCWRAKIRPEITESGKLIFGLGNCRRSDIRCSIHTFFEENKSSFQKLADTTRLLGEKASPQLQKALKRLKSAEGDERDLCDDRHCAEIGDFLIAVDGASIPVFAANNDEDWKPIAEALGKTLINPLRG